MTGSGGSEQGVFTAAVRCRLDVDGFGLSSGLFRHQSSEHPSYGLSFYDTEGLGPGHFPADACPFYDVHHVSYVFISR